MDENLLPACLGAYGIDGANEVIQKRRYKPLTALFMKRLLAIIASFIGANKSSKYLLLGCSLQGEGDGWPDQIEPIMSAPALKDEASS